MGGVIGPCILLWTNGSGRGQEIKLVTKYKIAVAEDKPSYYQPKSKRTSVSVSVFGTR